MSAALGTTDATANEATNPRWPWRALAFGLLLVIYGLFSSSTPDGVGIPELLIAFLLLLAVGATGPVDAMGGFLARRLNGSGDLLIHVSFLMMLVVPTVVGLAVRGNQLSDFARDFIPLLYLYLPVFLLPVIRRDPRLWSRVLVGGLCVVGIAFSIRHFLSDQVGLAALGEQVVFGDKNYFPMDPAVIFASTFLLCFGACRLFERKFISGAALLFLGLIAFASLVAIIVRAQIVLVMFSVMVYAFSYGLYFRRTAVTVAMLLLFLCGVILFLLTSDVVAGIWSLVAAKSQAAGLLNARDLEFLAVIQKADTDLYSLVGGTGWGGVVDTVTGGQRVRFTHNLILYFVLKAGLVGLLSILGYVLPVGASLVKRTSDAFSNSDGFKISCCFAAGNALFVNTLLEAGYKSLTFGLILVVVLMPDLHPAGQERTC